MPSEKRRNSYVEREIQPSAISVDAQLLLLKDIGCKFSFVLCCIMIRSKEMLDFCFRFQRKSMTARRIC
ncbi:hypothetical protein EVA_15765 [gut metagenome]|uniref:Uncharacterized protein n=1 Tax=gut metagenome TaxID=749906 RepID=J9FMI2_9ZZZZ